MQDKEFFLEKQRIVERMISLETTLATLTKVTEIKISNDRDILLTMQDNIQKLNYAINGNGSPGISEKIRMLEAERLEKKKHFTLIYGAILAGFGEWVWRTIGHFIK